MILLPIEHAGMEGSKSISDTAKPNPTSAVTAKECLSPFDWDMLNLASKANLHLFTDACKALSTT